MDPVNAPHIAILPVEVLDYIFDILSAPLRERKSNDPLYKQSRRWLASCQHTCRSLRTHARPKLFRDVRISSAMSFPRAQIARFLELANDLTMSALREVRTFAFYQGEDEFGDDPLGEAEQNLVGSVVNRLLEATILHAGQLRAVELAFVRVVTTGSPLRLGRGWESLGDELQSAMTTICSPTSPVKRLKLSGIGGLPMSLFASSQIDQLILKNTFIRSPGVQGEGRPQLRHLRLIRLNATIHPLNWNVIYALSSHLEELDILLSTRVAGLQGPSFPSKGASVAKPLFRKLKKVSIGTRPRIYPDGFITADSVQQCITLAEGFLITLPADDIPLLEELGLQFRVSVTQMIEFNSPSRQVQGWLIEDWAPLDERLVQILVTRSRRSETLLLRICFTFDFVLDLVYGAKDPPSYDAALQSLWVCKGLPRADLNTLFPLTTKAFPKSVSLHENFGVSYTYFSA